MLKIIQLIGDRNAGFIIGMLVIVCLATGSLVMNLYPEVYPPFFPFDLNFFFNPVQKLHTWLYLLIIVFLVFGMNLFACTIDSVIRLVKNRSFRKKSIAALLAHIALILALLAHLQEGFYGETRQVRITEQETHIPGIGAVRLESLENLRYPDGSLKDTVAVLGIDPINNKEPFKSTLSYNSPTLLNGGSREIIVQSGGYPVTGITVVNNDGEEIQFLRGKSQILYGGVLTLKDIVQSRFNFPVGIFSWLDPTGETQSVFMALDARVNEYNHIRIKENVYHYVSMTRKPQLIAMVRYNPAVFLMAISILALFVGSIMLIPLRRG